MEKLTLEEKKEKVQNFRPIDDVFFEAVAANKAVCEEILRTLLEDKELIVTDAIAQSSERNLYGRSVRLDVLCTLGDGTKCNVEVQRANSDNHLRRVRYNASAITMRESQVGMKFEDVTELIIVYISEFDFLKGNKTIYHVDKVLRETGTVIDDGLREIFVNTAVEDGTDIAELMSCFLKREVKNPKFPKLSEEVRRLKEEEGGVTVMCEIMQKYEDIAKEEGREEGRKEGREEGRKEGREEGRKEGREEGRKEGREEGREKAIIDMVRNNAISVETAAEYLGISEEKVRDVL